MNFKCPVSVVILCKLYTRIHCNNDDRTIHVEQLLFHHKSEQLQVQHQSVVLLDPLIVAQMSFSSTPSKRLALRFRFWAEKVSHQGDV